MIEQNYLYIGGAIVIALLIYRSIWKRSPNIALIVLLLSLVATILVFGDWINWREYAFVTPDGNLGDLR